jgi:hypothetical protein
VEGLGLDGGRVMANAQKGEVDLVVGQGAEKRTLILRLGTNAMAEIETLLDGADFATEIIPSLAQGRNRATYIRAVIWGAARQHQPKIDLLAVGDLIDEFPSEIGEALRKLITLAFPVPEGGAENPPKQSDGTGTT